MTHGIHIPKHHPRGMGPPPLRIYQRWSTVRPLGAAMRHTALRQSPKDFPGPKHTRKMNSNSTNKDLHSLLLCECKPILTDFGKDGRAGLHAAPYGGAVHAPCSTDQPNPLPKLTTPTFETRNNHMLLTTAPIKTSS